MTGPLPLALGHWEANALPYHKQDPVVACKEGQVQGPSAGISRGLQGGPSALDTFLLLDGAGTQLGASLVVASPPQEFLRDGSQGAGTVPTA